MNNLKDKMTLEMKITGYSKETIKTYTFALNQLFDHFKKLPSQITSEEIKIFLIHKRNQNLSQSTLRMYGYAIKYFYDKILIRDIKIPYIATKKPKSLVLDVLTVAEVLKLINKAPDLKIQTIIMTFYGTGIRLSELISLRLENIDSEQMRIKVLGKGNKERYVKLSDSLLKQFRKYWKVFKPIEYLFEAKWPKDVFAHQYHTTSIQKRFSLAKKAAGISTKGGPHILRHAYATHMIEGGVSVVVLQRLLGHSTIRATLVYLKLSNSYLGDAKCPLDMNLMSKKLKVCK